MQSAQVVKELFSKNPSLYNRVAVISFYPNILYKVGFTNSLYIHILAHFLTLFYNYTSHKSTNSPEVIHSPPRNSLRVTESSREYDIYQLRLYIIIIYILRG